MRILFIIYLVISFLSLITILLALGQVKREIKRTYPNLKKPHYSVGEKAISIFRTLLLCFCPIVHTIVLLAFILVWDKVVEKAIDDIIHEWHCDCE